MLCHSCQLQLPDEANFCAWCGVPQAQPCAACHYALGTESRFCPQCGHRRGSPLQATVAVPAAPPKADPTGDRRVVTVLFTDVSGFTSMSEKLQPEEVTKIVNDFFAVLTEPIYRYGGVVDKYIGDAIMALFGAPVAHEDDPERAVRAGFEMQERAAVFAEDLEKRTGIRLRVRIGINTGLVVAGAVGGAQKRDYTVMGDTVNLAQRMEGAAKVGKVLVTYETYRHTSHVIEYLALDPIEVKGKNEPLPVYEVAGVKEDAAPHHEPRRFIGRVTELVKLRDAFQRALDGTPQLVYLTGDAGVGKSQLSSELVAGLDPALEVDAQRVRAISYEQGTPYALVRDLLRRWLGIRDTNDPAAQANVLLERVELASVPRAEQPLVLAAIGLLLGNESDNPELEQLSPQQRRILAFRSFNRVLLAERRPLLLNFEDLHWADEASVEWIQSLFDSLASREYQDARVLVICQARSVEGSPLAVWKPQLETHALVLRPLSETESWTMVASLLEIEAATDTWPESLRKVTQQVLSRAEGNPMFLRELVKSLVDAGVLEKRDHGWEIVGEAGASLPTNVNGVVLSRIDRLSADQRSVLQLASVVGRSFQPTLIESVGNQDELAPVLDGLAHAEFVHKRSSGEWAFHQALIHEVVYNSLLIATRRDLHRRVGETLERSLAERSEEIPQVLARHYMLGEVSPKALYYLFRSGEVAHRNFSNQEALNCFKECLALIERGVDLPPRPRHDEVLLSLADLLATTGEYGTALEHLSSALAMQTDPALKAETLRRMGGVINLQGQFNDAMARYDEGLGLLEGDAAPLTHARILLDKSLSLFRQGQYSDVIELCQQSLSLLEGTSHTKELAMAQSILGIVWYRQNRLSDAEQYHQRALALREQIQDVFGVASSLNNLGALYLELGEWPKAADHYERALRIYQQIGDVSRQIIQENNLGDLLRNKGDLVQAETLHRQALELSQRSQDTLGAGIAASGVGLVLVAAKRPAEAIEPLKQGIDIMRGINAVEVLPEPLVALARAHTQLQEIDEARAALDQALKQAEENQSHSQIGLARCAEALWYELTGNLDAACDATRSAVAAFGEEAAPIERARAWAIEARVLMRLGDAKAAEERRDEALAVFRQLGAAADLADMEALAIAP